VRSEVCGGSAQPGAGACGSSARAGAAISQAKAWLRACLCGHADAARRARHGTGTASCPARPCAARRSEPPCLLLLLPPAPAPSAGSSASHDAAHLERRAQPRAALRSRLLHTSAREARLETHTAQERAPFCCLPRPTSRRRASAEPSRPRFAAARLPLAPPAPHSSACRLAPHRVRARHAAAAAATREGREGRGPDVRVNMRGHRTCFFSIPCLALKGCYSQTCWASSGMAYAVGPDALSLVG
jgi:hypothetical protein